MCREKPETMYGSFVAQFELELWVGKKYKKALKEDSIVHRVMAGLEMFKH